MGKLERELKESNDDFYQISEKNEELNQLLSQARLEHKKTEQRLNQEVDENFRLKASQEKINQNLLAKVNELTNLKKLNKQEREQCKNIIAQQSEQYEQERKEREQKFTQTVNNLRTFQLNADIPNRFKRTHKSALSTSSLPTSRSNSPRNSFYTTIEDDRIIFSSSPSASPLSSELNQQGYQEKSGTISSDFTTTPQQENTDPLESKNKKRQSNSPALIRSPSPKRENIDDVLEKLLGEVANLEEEQQQEAEKSELITEIDTLKNEVSAAQKAYKTLFDEKVEQERTLQNFNEKELAWETERAKYEKLLQQINQEKLTQQNEQQKLTEELAEMKYKLAETDNKQKQTAKQVKKDN